MKIIWYFFTFNYFDTTDKAMNTNKKQPSKEKKGKLSFSKINAWLHLWLGIGSGLIVVIISLTGAMLVFESEITSMSSPWLHANATANAEQMPPSAIYKSVHKNMPDKVIQSVWYNGPGKTAKVSIKDSDSLVFVNPYNAAVVAVVDHEDFFHVIEEGHFHLWLPHEIGEIMTSWGTFIFFFLLISGLILWYPKKWNKANRNKSFKIKWSSSFKRLNYDLHNVLGFYSLIIAIIMAFTGLCLSFNWFREGVYWASGGQTEEKSKKEHIVETTAHGNSVDKLAAADYIWLKVRNEIAQENKEAVIISFNEKPEDNIYACTDMYLGVWRDLYFDPKTLKLLPASQVNVSEEPFANWLRRSNYSLHTGMIGGIATKIIYFIASTICASLPITGFLVWLGKKKKKKPSLKNQ